MPVTIDLTGRDGQRLPWALPCSTTYDLFGTLGIAMGGLGLAVIILFAAIRLFGLPPLTAPPAQQQQQQQQQSPLDQEPQQQQPQQQQAPSPSASDRKTPEKDPGPWQPPNRPRLPRF